MFQRKTVASVLSSFQKTVDDLNEIQKRENQNIGRIQIEITQLEAEKQNSIQESVAAENIAKKIANLISA